MSVKVFLMAFGEMAVGRIQVVKECHDKFLRVLTFGFNCEYEKSSAARIRYTYYFKVVIFLYENSANIMTDVSSLKQ